MKEKRERGERERESRKWYEKQVKGQAERTCNYFIYFVIYYTICFGLDIII